VEPKLDTLDALRDPARLVDRLRLVPRTLRVALLELLHEPGRGDLGKPAREQEVARVPACDVDDVAAQAELVDVLRENDVHGLLVAHVRQEGELAGALDRDRDLALVAPAGAADPPRANLALLRNVTAKLVDVLVVDLVHLRLAEEAGLAAPAPHGCGPLSRGGAVGLLLSQERSPLRTGCRRRRPRSRR